MLHLEIRQENGQYSAYSVDHNPNAPVDTDLLIEGDGWKKPNSDDIYYSLIFEQGKWRIRAGIEGGDGGNPNSIYGIGTLFSEHDTLLGIAVALFNAAPGQQYLSEFSTAVSNGLTEPQLADILAAHPVFTDGVMSGKLITAQAQVKELMNHFGLVADDVQGSAASIAETFFTQRIESNVGHGAIAAEATFYLLSNPLLGNKVLEQFSPTSLLFKLKIFVADNYSVNNSSTDLATLQKVLAGITLQVGTDDPDRIEGSPFGGVIEGRLGGDVIILEIGQNARDILLLNGARDSQILNIGRDNIVTIREDNNHNLFFDVLRKFSVNAADTGDGIEASNPILGNDNNNSFFDVVTNFSGGAADTDDRIDLSSFNFTDTQPGLLDVSARVSIDTDLTLVLDLFSDGIAGDHGLAFLEYSDASGFITFLFGDANKDGDFTAADDMFVALVGVDDLIDANIIYTVGSVNGPAIDPAGTTFSMTADAGFVTEGDGITYTVTASEAVADDTDVVFTVIAGDTAAADQGTTNTNLSDFVAGTFNPVTVTIPVGGTTATFSLTTLNDGLIENDENYSVQAAFGNGILTTAILSTNTSLLDGPSGTTLALTTFTDIITGSSSGDVINGFVGIGASSTLTAADIVSGGSGIDTFNITNASDASVTNTNGAQVSGIEIFNLRGLTVNDTFTFVAAGISDVTVINGSLSLGALTVTDNADGVSFISTGVGNDVITLTDKTGGSGTTVTGGAGADAITTQMIGNAASDSMKFVYKAGDSVSDSSATGISATLTDTIANLDGDTLSATSGSFAEFDTEVQATAVTAGATDVVLGSTTVANAGDFFVNIENATTTWIYQDTDGDKIIEAGEFAVSLTGIQSNTLLAADFTVSGGDLMLMTT